MLRILRKKYISKIIFWGLVILIMPAFVLWGTGSIGRSREKSLSCVGIIDEKKVSLEEFAESLTSAKCQIILNYFNQPKILGGILNNRLLLGKLAWDRIIMARETKKYDLTVSDKEVVDYIRTHPIFLRDGNFDDRFYLYILRNNMGIEPRNFEEIARENLKIQKFNDLLVKDLKPAEEDIILEYRQDNEKFKISYVVIKNTDFLDKVSASDDEIKDYYEKHKDELQKPLEKIADEKEASGIIGLEDLKPEIKKIISEEKAIIAAFEYAKDEYKKIVELAKKENRPFEKAAEALGLKVQQTALFSKSDSFESIGKTDDIVKLAVKLKKDDVAGPVVVSKGALIFKLIETEGFDENKFKEKKEEYSKKVLDAKKVRFLEEWLRDAEKRATLNMDLNDYEKYYR